MEGVRGKGDVNPTWTQQSQSLDTLLPNPLVFSNILGYMSPSEPSLCPPRRLSTPKPPSKDNRVVTLNIPTTEEREEMKRLKLGSKLDELIGKFPTCHHRNIDIWFKAPLTTGPLFLAKMDGFLSTFGEQIQSLKTCWGIDDEDRPTSSQYLGHEYELSGFGHLDRFLTLVPSVVQLDLKVDISKWRNFNLDWPLGGNRVLPSVQSVLISFVFPDLRSADDLIKLRNFCRRLNRLTPNIRSLEIGFCTPHCFEEIFMDELVHHSSQAGNLTSFRKSFRMSSPEMIQNLEPFPSLMRIELDWVVLGLCGGYVQDLLNKNSTTLELVSIRVDRERGIRSIVLPYCPNLKSLCIGSYNDCPAEEVWGSVDIFGLRSMWEAGPEHFHHKFPALTKIQIQICDHGYHPGVYDYLFPLRADLVFPQLTRMDVVDAEKGADREGYEDWTHGLRRMFPNAQRKR